MVTTASSLDDGLRDELTDLTMSLCKAFTDPKRLFLLYLLRDGAHTVGEMSEAIGARQANTSQHLAVLRERGLVEATRRGNNVEYSLRHPSVLDAIDVLRDVQQQELTRRSRSA